jgi:hypothetical protein
MNEQLNTGWLAKRALQKSPKKRSNFDIHELADYLGGIPFLASYKGTEELRSICAEIKGRQYAVGEAVFN